MQACPLQPAAGRINRLLGSFVPATFVIYTYIYTFLKLLAHYVEF